MDDQAAKLKVIADDIIESMNTVLESMPEIERQQLVRHIKAWAEKLPDHSTIIQ